MVATPFEHGPEPIAGTMQRAEVPARPHCPFQKLLSCPLKTSDLFNCRNAASISRLRGRIGQRHFEIRRDFCTVCCRSNRFVGWRTKPDWFFKRAIGILLATACHLHGQYRMFFTAETRFLCQPFRLATESLARTRAWPSKPHHLRQIA